MRSAEISEHLLFAACSWPRMVSHSRVLSRPSCLSLFSSGVTCNLCKIETLSLFFRGGSQHDPCSFPSRKMFEREKLNDRGSCDLSSLLPTCSVFELRTHGNGRFNSCEETTCVLSTTGIKVSEGIFGRGTTPIRIDI